MSLPEKAWLSLSEASALLGVHPTTLRRWSDSGHIPYLRTPGGHRRFRAADLAAWTQGTEASALALQSETLVRDAVRYTRREMARKDVSHEAWYTAFDQEEGRQQMRETGRRLLGLAIQYMSRSVGHEPILEEGRRIGEFYGQQSAEHGITLEDAVRALFFFRESLQRSAEPGQAGLGQYDAEDVQLHRRLRRFMDEVTFACLASYEAAYRRGLPPGGV